MHTDGHAIYRLLSADTFGLLGVTPEALPVVQGDVLLIRCDGGQGAHVHIIPDGPGRFTPVGKLDIQIQRPLPCARHRMLHRGETTPDQLDDYLQHHYVATVVANNPERMGAINQELGDAGLQ